MVTLGAFYYIHSQSFLKLHHEHLVRRIVFLKGCKINLLLIHENAPCFTKVFGNELLKQKYDEKQLSHGR